MASQAQPASPGVYANMRTLLGRLKALGARHPDALEQCWQEERDAPLATEYDPSEFLLSPAKIMQNTPGSASVLKRVNGSRSTTTLCNAICNEMEEETEMLDKDTFARYIVAIALRAIAGRKAFDAKRAAATAEAAAKPPQESEGRQLRNSTRKRSHEQAFAEDAVQPSDKEQSLDVQVAASSNDGHQEAEGAEQTPATELQTKSTSNDKPSARPAKQSLSTKQDLEVQITGSDKDKHETVTIKQVLPIDIIAQEQGIANFSDQKVDEVADYASSRVEHAQGHVEMCTTILNHAEVETKHVKLEPAPAKTALKHVESSSATPAIVSEMSGPIESSNMDKNMHKIKGDTPEVAMQHDCLDFADQVSQHEQCPVVAAGQADGLSDLLLVTAKAAGPSSQEPTYDADMIDWEGVGELNND